MRAWAAALSQRRDACVERGMGTLTGDIELLKATRGGEAEAFGSCLPATARSSWRT